MHVIFLHNYTKMTAVITYIRLRLHETLPIAQLELGKDRKKQEC